MAMAFAWVGITFGAVQLIVLTSNPVSAILIFNTTVIFTLESVTASANPYLRDLIK
jgi:molybdopterin biosynthesis enzyme